MLIMVYIIIIWGTYKQAGKKGARRSKKSYIIAPNLASWSTKEGRFVFGLTTIKPKKPKSAQRKMLR